MVSLNFFIWTDQKHSLIELPLLNEFYKLFPSSKVKIVLFE